MCGRFNFIFNTTMQALFSDLGITASLTNRFNIAPTESVAIILEHQKHYECHLARWWLTPSWSNGPDSHYSMFNARAENLEHSRAFKGPFHHKRCIIPATSFIEWQTGNGDDDKDKQAYEIFRPEQQPIAFAGLWDCWNDEMISCAIVTTQATQSMQTIHPRMPVMLNKQGIKQWLNPDAEIASLFIFMADQQPYPLQAQAVDRAINNPRAKVVPKAVGDIIYLAQ